MSPRVGVTLSGRYRLQRLIATGGMGQVWEGVDSRLGRRVAIKVLKAEYSTDAEFVERFRAEARTVAMLNHPGIAGVYDYGETDIDGEGRTAYLVMELVNGEPLNSVLKRTGRLVAAARAGHARADRPRIAGRPHRGPGAPRRQTGKHPDHPHRAGKTDRLRHRQGRRRGARDADRHGDGHRPVHRSRAGARPRRHRCQRRVLTRRGGLRIRVGQTPVHRGRRADRGDEAHQGEPSPASCRPAPQRA